jgi:hypothetical protein
MPRSSSDKTSKRKRPPPRLSDTVIVDGLPYGREEHPIDEIVTVAFDAKLKQVRHNGGFSLACADSCA